MPGYPAVQAGKVHGFLSHEVTLVPGLPRPVVQPASRIIAQGVVEESASPTMTLFLFSHFSRIPGR